jgi:integrase
VEGKNYKTQLVESAPKSFYSKREIPLSDQLYALLIKFKSSKTYLVNGDHPMDPRSYQYKFKQYLKKAGLADWNFHVLRHTFATNCIDNGADVKCVSELLGHADVKITLNRYVHPSMDTKRKQMNALSSAYGKLFA